MENLKAIASRFNLEGGIGDIKPFGNGLINDSYLIKNSVKGRPDYIMQRINHAVFTNVDLLQSNILAVTRHIRKKLIARGETDVERKVLEFMPAADGKSYSFDGRSYWRVMKFIPGSVSYEAVTPEYSRMAGEAFGRFEEMLSDIPDRLGETIPKFHDMEFRLGQLRQAVAENKSGRLNIAAYFVEEIETGQK